MIKYPSLAKDEESHNIWVETVLAIVNQKLPAIEIVVKC